MRDKSIDVALIGGGIMSATLASLISRLEPSWTIRVYERLDSVAEESSNAWNNAGTGHAALCELNYMPEAADGSVSAAKAVSINEQFQVSRQYWSALVKEGALPSPSTFITATPHMTFVTGTKDVEYLRRRVDALREQPLFAGMEYTESLEKIAEWAPLMVAERVSDQRVAATRIASGTDVDFGAITRSLFADIENRGAVVAVNQDVLSVKRSGEHWRLRIRDASVRIPYDVSAKFVFVGAGGGALKLLQSAGIPEIKGFGGFPISGQFLRTTNPKIVSQHNAKVYGKAAVGAPPMSVPHLDTRVVGGERTLLFGPFAGFTPKFLKSGSLLDLPLSVRLGNIVTMLQVGARNLGLLKYLFGEVIASKAKKVEALRAFMPTAKSEDWELITAGQRVQVMKQDVNDGGVLQLGTEVITSSDGTIAGLLGASPGASTAVSIMLDVLARCFPERNAEWTKELRKLIPSLGTKLSDDPAKAAASLAATAEVLGLA